MRLLLRTGNFITKNYHINLQRDSIVGWFGNQWLRPLLGLPPGLNFDSHFTYPQDGNLHFTYETRNNDNTYIQRVSVFTETVRVRTTNHGIVTLEIRNRGEMNEQLTHLVPRFRCPPLIDVRTHQFVGGSLTVIDGVLPVFEDPYFLILPNRVRRDDLVIDVSREANSLLNIWAIIRHVDDHSSFIEHAQRYATSIPMSHDRVLELACYIQPNI